MPFKNKKGFTLVELIVTITVLMVISTIFGWALINAIKAYAANKELNEIQYSARMALLSITRDLRTLSTDTAQMIVADEDELIMPTTPPLTYSIKMVDGVSTLTRTGASDIYFAQVPMQSLKTEWSPDNRSLEITVVHSANFDFTTTISVARIP